MPLIDPVDVTAYEKMTIQIRNADNTSTPKVRVYGSIFPVPGATPTATTPLDSGWVQIGDDIDIGASSGALKSISTTAFCPINPQLVPTCWNEKVNGGPTNFIINKAVSVQI